MASSLYHSSGPGRHTLLPQGTQPQQYGATPFYNYTGPLPPGQMAYNPTYSFGSSVAPDGYTHTQNRYYPSPNLPIPPPPQHPMQPPHQSNPYTSDGNTFPQPYQPVNHAAFYSTQLPLPPPQPTQLPPPRPLPTQLPPPPRLPIPHSSLSQTSSYGNFPSTYQSLPPAQPPFPVSYYPPLNSYFPSTLLNLPSLQPAQSQNAAEVVTQNTQAGRASTVEATQANWSTQSDMNITSSTQAAWNLLSSQPSALAASMQQTASSKEMTTRALLPTNTLAMTKNEKRHDPLKPIQQGTALKKDNKSKGEPEHREKRKRGHERKLEEKRQKDMQSRFRAAKIRPVVAPLAKYTSEAGSRDGRTIKKLGSSSDKMDNRLKRPSTFVCKIKFRNGLPDPVSQPKLLQVNNDKERYCKHAITSLDKVQKHKFLTDFDLGIPLDLLDLRIYNPPNIKRPMDPEDEDLLRDDENLQSAIVDSVRKKDRPTDKGVAWLVKTQYISTVNFDISKQSLTAKQAKELKETREGKREFLESLNDREQQIRSIEESFRAAQQRPIHQTKPSLEPVEILPLFPDFERWSDKYMHIGFDGEPTADSKLHSTLNRTVRNELEAQAILKSYRVPNSDDVGSERFLAYMVPQVEELYKNSIDEAMEVSYAWTREYHFEPRSEDLQMTSNYIFLFGDQSVQYLPLQTKITLRKKRANEGRFKEETEVSFTIPSSVTVCQREFSQEEEKQREASRLALTEGVVLSTGLTSSLHAKRSKSFEAAASSSPLQNEETDGTTHENKEEVDM